MLAGGGSGSGIMSLTLGERSPHYSQLLDFSSDWAVIDIFDALTFLAYFPGACTNP